MEAKEKDVLIDRRLPIEKLCDALILGGRRGKGKGWYQRGLGLGNGRFFFGSRGYSISHGAFNIGAIFEGTFCLSETSRNSSEISP